MRSSRALLLLALAAALVTALVAPSAFAQDDDDEFAEPKGIELQGFFSGAFVQSYQDTSLSGGDFDDGNGLELMAGFQAGDYLLFTAGWEMQRDDDYTTHFFPVTVRFLSPKIVERVHLFGEAGLGLFFSRLRNQFDNSVDENERGSAARLRAGVELDIAAGFSAVVYGGYTWGMGSTSDYDYASLGLGLQYRWGL